jgi:hypothetical protein
LRGRLLLLPTSHGGSHGKQGNGNGSDTQKRGRPRTE